MNRSAFRKINRNLGKAVCDYRMIEEGDRIAVGISGGKDSLTLLWFLRDLKCRAPVSYNLFPIHIDPGFAGGVADNLVEYCKSLDYMLTMDYTDHGPMAHNIGNRENPCFLCSKLRRKRLFEISDRLGCNKLALAHHKDDIIETFFMNICYSGEISTMVPKQQFFNGKLHLIRPLAYTDESTIQQFARSIDLPEFINPCPSSGTSRRREMRTFLDRLYESNRKIKGNIFSAMSRVKQDYLLKRAKL